MDDFSEGTRVRVAENSLIRAGDTGEIVGFLFPFAPKKLPNILVELQDGRRMWFHEIELEAENSPT